MITLDKIRENAYIVTIPSRKFVMFMEGTPEQIKDILERTENIRVTEIIR